MKQNLLFSAVLTAGIMTAAIGCNSTSQTATNTDTMANTSATDTAQANTLTEAEKNDGYTLLFNGQNMDGWRTYKNKKSDSWSAVDGILYCKGDSTNKSDLRADLITEKQFENFDLSVDWKISPQGNSGIIYLATEDNPGSYQSGPEYQIIDDKNFPQKLETWQMTGANYAMNPAPDAAPNPVGQWNTSRIVKNGNHVEHWLNGKKIVEYEINSEEWKKNKTEGKWKDTPNYGTAKKGHIVLQDHGSEAWFRNIKIKEL